MVEEQYDKEVHYEQQFNIKAQRKLPKYKTMDYVIVNECINRSVIFKPNAFPCINISKTSLSNKNYMPQTLKKDINSSVLQKKGKSRLSSTDQAILKTWNCRGSNLSTSNAFINAEKYKRAEMFYLQNLLKIDNLGLITRGAINPLTNIIKKEIEYEESARTEEKSSEEESNSKEMKLAIANYMAVISSNKYKVSSSFILVHRNIWE
jgi:hypothetical protein